jgi:hypothetical protein
MMTRALRLTRFWPMADPSCVGLGLWSGDALGIRPVSSCTLGDRRTRLEKS